ncbi:putative uncharacterized protein [Blautia hydrogenotrophica CAG:147]|uniref:hypothetical protein n=1 Tax=Blautia hydrogenotrophica TaxID=53443 RepID=UPI0003350F7A|nr:hypothetical protein [Blautia hydrogenotrophica]CCX58201.1 putative uncharacterized protein [Blautia hydrogenotrophica CAG:147]
MKNIKEIEKIYFNFEKLADDYRDLPETLAAHRKTMEFLTAHKMPEKIKLEVDDLLSGIVQKGERQGFLYGFQYAIRCDIAQEGERQGFLYGFQYAIRLLIGEGGTEA